MARQRQAPPRARPYHHGDLRRAILSEAVKAIAEQGPAALSMRELARRVGVSHAASVHHFGDKAGLLTAVATEGYRLFAAALRDAYERTGSLLEVGVAYVRFAVDHQPYFAIMFRPELYRTDDVELAAARQAAREMLYMPLQRMAGGEAEFDTLKAGIAAWSLVHGLAVLLLNGNLPAQLGDDPEQIARSVAAYLFHPLPRGGEASP